MHCPNCATKISGEQKFCRACGLNLEKVHQLLSEELSTAELHAENRIRRLEHWRNVAGLWTGAAFAITVLGVFIYQIAINLQTGSSDFYAALIGLVLFLGIVTAISFTAYSAYLRHQLTSRKMQQAITPADAAPTVKLPAEAHRIEMSSITEHTTEIFETDHHEGETHGNQSSPAARVRSRDGEHAQNP